MSIRYGVEIVVGPDFFRTQIVVPAPKEEAKKVRIKPITEKEFMEQVIEYAKMRGWLVAHFRGVRVQRKDGTAYYQTPVQADGAGFPDLFMVRDMALAAECKVGKNKATPEQEYWLKSLEEAGIPAYLWTPDSWPEIEKVLR